MKHCFKKSCQKAVIAHSPISFTSHFKMTVSVKGIALLKNVFQVKSTYPPPPPSEQGLISGPNIHSSEIFLFYVCKTCTAQQSHLNAFQAFEEWCSATINVQYSYPFMISFDLCRTSAPLQKRGTNLVVVSQYPAQSSHVVVCLHKSYRL